MTRIHFVYPHGSSSSNPEAIGRNVYARLRGQYEVVQHDWAEPHRVWPEPGDVLLGHPHPARGTVFRRSAKHSGWSRVIMMTPYTHDLRQVAYCDPIVARCDLYLAITGRYWFDSIEKSRLEHWRPKMVHVDLAIDRRDFPVLKQRFNDSGSRRFLYIGHAGWQKNPRYLEEIAAAMPHAELSWMGIGRRLRGLTRLGPQDFRTEAARELVASHDFLFTVGRFDANPTTVLEAMAWGLIPACTPTSGYCGYPGIANIPLDDVGRAVGVLEGLQHAPEPELLEMQRENWAALDRHFNWDRFAAQVAAAVSSDESPPIRRERLGRKLRLRAAALVAPNRRPASDLRKIARRLDPTRR